MAKERRKPKYDPSKFVNCRVEPHIKQKLADIAEREGLTTSILVRKAIKDYVGRELATAGK